MAVDDHKLPLPLGEGWGEGISKRRKGKVLFSFFTSSLTLALSKGRGNKSDYLIDSFARSGRALTFVILFRLAIAFQRKRSHQVGRLLWQSCQSHPKIV